MCFTALRDISITFIFNSNICNISMSDEQRFCCSSSPFTKTKALVTAEDTSQYSHDMSRQETLLLNVPGFFQEQGMAFQDCLIPDLSSHTEDSQGQLLQ